MVSAEEDILWLERGSWNTCEMKAEGGLIRQRKGTSGRAAERCFWGSMADYLTVQSPPGTKKISK